jgi:lysyl-tRNA synthetase class 2
MIELARSRAEVVRAIRKFFDSQGFLEVDTPVALTAPAPELNIDAPAVELRVGDEIQRRFLQTSPELPMKRLLAAGLERIYQVAPVFRDGDLSAQHRPEFRLLEWYRRDVGWEALLDDCEGLLRACARAAGQRDLLRTRGRSVELAGGFRRLTVDQAFRSYAGFSILDALTLDSLRARAREAGVHTGEDDDWEDLFHRVFLNRVEPQLAGESRPVFLTHFPAPLASLARLSPDDPRTSERFELYVAGVELANGFGELTDATEQRRRFERDRARRAHSGLRDYPLDERFFTALDQLPAAAGIALGIERLLMLLLDSELDAVTLIPWSAT